MQKYKSEKSIQMKKRLKLMTMRNQAHFIGSYRTVKLSNTSFMPKIPIKQNEDMPKRKGLVGCLLMPQSQREPIDFIQKSSRSMKLRQKQSNRQIKEFSAKNITQNAPILSNQAKTIVSNMGSTSNLCLLDSKSLSKPLLSQHRSQTVKRPQTQAN